MAQGSGTKANTERVADGAQADAVPAGDPTAGDPPDAAPVTGNTRRGILIGVGLAGVAGLAAACGGSDDSSGGTGSGDAGSGGQTPSPGGSDGGGAGGKALASAADIPVGGGKVFEAEKVVVCQPAQGEFTAFSTTCTHRGCPVGSVSGGTINCPCHGSKFKITDGSVVNPPAKKPLKGRKVTVQGGKIMLA